MTKGLYDDEIDYLGSRMLKGIMTRWMGVFARDELPSEEELLRAQLQSGNRHFAFVFNNQPASEPGQHWLTIYGKAAPLVGGSLAAATQTSAGGRGGLHIDVEFFDYYAMPPAAYSLHSHFKRISRTFLSIRFNRLALRCLVSIDCIFYSLARTAIHFLLYSLASRTTMCILARPMSMSTRAYASILHLALHCSLHVTVVRAKTTIVNVHVVYKREMMIRVYASRYE